MKLFLSCVLGWLACVYISLLGQETLRPDVPKAWDEPGAQSMDLPLAALGIPTRHQVASTYYKRQIYQLQRAYPVYAPGREPAGYMDWLRQQDVSVVSVDPTTLQTEADWIHAGEALFNGARRVNEISVEDLHDSNFYKTTGVPVAGDGTVPAYRYFVRKKGDVVVSAARCAFCHTRVLPNGDVVVGAQGNMPATFIQGFVLQRALSNGAAPPGQDQRTAAFRDFSVPWLNPDPAASLRQLSLADLAAAYMSVPPGVVARPDTTLSYPPKTPDLIGVKDRKYLDATGLIQHRSIADLMRYAALVEGLYVNDRYGERESLYGLPDEAPLPRFSDEQLYAIALYVYSLKPPANPNKPNDTTRRGERVFQREGCGTCHTPPLYTNNMLTPALGFIIPADHRAKYSILPTSVGTDPRLALQSRKGTGYYRPPSLRGVWYRRPFEHNGSVASLEDWFDSRRLRDDYVPTGFRGFNLTRRAVRGHEFGLNLGPEDKAALIAFLNTL